MNENTEQSESAPISRSVGGWNYLRYGVALLLLFAAATKVINTPQILAGGGLLSSLPLLAGVIGYESAVAAWLVVGPQRWTWRLTLLTFSVFVASTVYAILTGRSCSCFGEQLSPAVMLAIDIVVIVMALLFRPGPSAHRGRPTVVHLTVCAVLGCSFAGVAVWRDQAVDRSEPLEFLLADMLTGRQWPLDERLHPGLSPLSDGRWMVLVVRHDCDHCRQLLAEHFSDPARHRDDERTAILIAGSSEWPFQLDQVSIETAGEATISWPGEEPFVASPAVFLLEDAIVVQAADGNDADAFVDQLFSVPGSSPLSE